tara:strand:+ start:348 stop:788 length:441 start_codon:yes stop_codon:yes gene_type:complete
MENDKKEVASTLEELESSVSYVCAKMDIYVKALDQIAQADDQANPIALRNRARIALIQEPTTADKSNENPPVVSMFTKDKGILDGNPFGGDTGTDADFSGPNDPGDEHHDRSAELAEYDKKMKEDAEAAWRDTVLHPEYKSEYEEE